MNEPEIVRVLVAKDERIQKLEAENKKLREGVDDLLTYVQEMREQGDTDLRQIIYTIQQITK